MIRFTLSHLFIWIPTSSNRTIWGYSEGWAIMRFSVTGWLTAGHVSTEFQRHLQHGMYNGGFVAQQDSDTRRFLNCWAKLLESQCTLDP
jgi:hypothetical protein